MEQDGPTGSRPLELLMTLYLTDTTTPEDIDRAKASGVVHACKLYPAGATTNSEFGVTSIEKVYPVLQVYKLHMLLVSTMLTISH